LSTLSIEASFQVNPNNEVFMARKRLGEILLERGAITKTQLAHALHRQEQYGGRIGANLVKAGVISEEDLMRFLGIQTGVREIDLNKVKLKPKVVKKIPRKIALKYTVLPLGMKDKSTLVVACSDPTDLGALDEVSFITGNRVIPMLAPYSKILAKLNDFYESVPLADGAPVHGTEGEGIGLTPGGAKAALTDPELLIFGDQTVDGLDPLAPPPDASRPLEPVQARVTHQRGATARDDDEFTLDFSPTGSYQAVATPPAKTGQFTMEQRLRALYHVMLRKNLISEDEIEKELMRLWSLGEL
jgi:type IV pilus assembly protein PilB